MHELNRYHFAAWATALLFFISQVCPALLHACTGVIAAEAPRAARPPTLQELADEQRQILVEHFPFYFGELTRQSGFPLSIRALRPDEIASWETDYLREFGIRIFSERGSLRGTRVSQDVFGLNAPANGAFLERVVRVVFTQWMLAKVQLAYRARVSKAVPNRNSRAALSRHQKEKFYREALQDVRFYRHKHLDRRQAFGFDFPLIEPSLSQQIRLRERVPALSRDFLTYYSRFLVDDHLRLGPEQLYLYQLLDLTWPSVD